MSGGQSGHQTQVACAWLAGGCIVPCFPWSDIQWGGCGSCSLLAPKDVSIHPFPLHSPFNRLSQDCHLLSPPVISKGWLLPLESFTSFPLVPPNQTWGFPGAALVPLGSCSDVTGVRPGAVSAERHACSNMQLWVLFFSFSLFVLFSCFASLAHLLFLTHHIRERLAIKSCMYFS